MYVQYGSYRHPENEVNVVNFEGRRIFTDRGDAGTIEYKMELVGEIVATGQAAIHARISEIVDAYAIQNLTLGLYHDDGTPTRHILLANSPDNLSGVRIVFHRWPKGEAEEYATQRTFHIVATAIFRLGLSQLVSWHEEVRTRGNCGPHIQWSQRRTGPPIAEILYQQTIQEIIQEGYAVGLDGFPLGFIPPPIHPQFELPHIRQIDAESPLNLGSSFTNYRMRWRYVMHTPIPFNTFPNIEFIRNL